MVIANEVLDVLPCHLIEFDGARWLERVVAAVDDRFVFRLQPIADAALAVAVVALGQEFPIGYQTEVRCGLDRFLAPLLNLLERGRLLFFDYGFARPELYDPARRQGTLRTFAGHHAGDDPLDRPGARDLTAHVDFTAVAEAAGGLGLVLARFEPQGIFLTRQASSWLDSLAARPAPARAAAVRQFQSLTHPAHLGAKFHALEFAWRATTDPQAAAVARRRLVCP
jgi:SAM-dependent MidA family methyltransferase